MESSTKSVGALRTGQRYAGPRSGSIRSRFSVPVDLHREHMGGTKSGGGDTGSRDRTRSHPKSPGFRQRVSSKARFPTRAGMCDAPIAKFNVGQRCVTGIASFRFSVRWTKAGEIVLRHLAVRTGFPVRPKPRWLFTKMALGTGNDPELCGVFPPEKKPQEESRIGHERRSHHRAFLSRRSVA